MPADVISPRHNTTQQVNTIRRKLSSTDPSVRIIGSIPVGSFISKVEAYVDTAYNAGTTNPVTVGTTTANANELLASGDVTAGTPGYYTNARGLGTGLTATPGTANSVGDPLGGVGIYAKYAPTGTAPTAGSCTVAISYIPPNEP